MSSPKLWTIVATGASSGLGFEAVRQLLHAAPSDIAYRIIIGARRVDAATSVQKTLAETPGSSINTLLLCAAIVKGNAQPVERAPYCEAFLVNYVAQQYLIHLLISSMSQAPSKIVFVSSRKYKDVPEICTTVATPFEIYNTSKFIQLLSLMKWRRSLPIDVGTIAVSPGFVPATRLGREFGLLGQVGSMLMRWTPFATSLEKGAEGIVRAIVQPYSLKESKEAFLGHSDKFEELDNALLDTSLQERWFLTQPQIEEALGLQPCR